MSETAQLKEVLRLLPGPAFFTDGQTATWCNDACRQIPLEKGDKILSLLGRSLSLYRQRSEESVAGFPVEAGSEIYSATVRRVGEEDLFLLQQQRPEDTSRLRSVAAAIHPALSTLLSVGSRLFPELEEAEDEATQTKTAALQQACFQLLRTVRSLRFFDRIVTSPQSLALRRTDLTAMLGELAAKTAEMLRDARIDLTADLPAKPVWGCVDSSSVAYAVLQLISNAAAFCGDDRQIELTAAESGRWLRIRVADHGAEMPQDILATAFSSADPGSDTDIRRGAGLGLPIVQAVARRHGGSAVIESGKAGTAVTMTLDLTLAAEVELRAPCNDLSVGYDDALIELSRILPPETYDSRNIDL